MITALLILSFYSVVGGWSLTRLMRTMDLTLLNPYFQGTTKRNGAPFWLGRRTYGRVCGTGARTPSLVS